MIEAVCKEKGKFPLCAVAVFFRLYFHPLKIEDDISQKQFAAVRIEAIRLAHLRSEKSPGFSKSRLGKDSTSVSASVCRIFYYIPDARAVC